jgi:hypothetical protein
MMSKNYGWLLLFKSCSIYAAAPTHCYVGTALEITQLDRFHAATNYEDDIKFPVGSESFRRMNPYHGCVRSFAFIGMLDVYPLEKSYKLRSYDDTSNDTSYLVNVFDQARISGSLGNQKEDWFLAAAAHLKCYAFELSFYEQPLKRRLGALSYFGTAVRISDKSTG